MYDQGCVDRFKTDLGDKFSWRKKEEVEDEDEDETVTPETDNEGGVITETEEKNQVTTSEEDDSNVAAVVIPIVLIILILSAVGILSYVLYKKDPESFKNRFRRLCKCCKRRSSITTGTSDEK